MTRRNLFTTLFAGVLFPKMKLLQFPQKPWRSTKDRQEPFEFDLGDMTVQGFPSPARNVYYIRIETIDAAGIDRIVPSLVKAFQKAKHDKTRD